MTPLSGQTLVLPPASSFLRAWKSPPQFPPPHPLHTRLTDQVINPILTSLIPHPKALQKAIEYDTALLVCGLFPSLTSDSDFEKLKTVAIWLVWIVLWDDAIDSSSSGSINAEEYVRLSKEYVRGCLLGWERGEPEAPSRVCELVREVGERLRGVNAWREGDRVRLWEKLERYMDDCLVEYDVRMSGGAVTEEGFWIYRTGTSGVGAFCQMGRVMNGGGGLPGEVLGWEEVRNMEVMVNKSFVLVNELFSLKKELKDGPATNLIPIAMHDGNCDLAWTVKRLMDDYVYWGSEFRNIAARLRARVEEEYGGEIMEMVEKTIEAYEAVVTGILEFSVQSPRYGMKQYEREDGYFEIPL
ncbi:isoprenoid synthase domain-containing protein [Cercophora samala]|uniref:Terpene synthase n=1 Tax=Cercophora samala TaxID=330535 RepID=A0AA39ZJ55_9PEZI|nr:isoprenoid synthase domain-containing protein [Cercophora samala]